jgi:hypothetical protein
MAHKNDYSVIVFFPNDKPKKWGFVHKLDGFAKFLDEKHPDWEYMNVYNRRTREYLTRFIKGAVVPEYLFFNL